MLNSLTRLIFCKIALPLHTRAQPSLNNVPGPALSYARLHQICNNNKRNIAQDELQWAGRPIRTVQYSIAVSEHLCLATHLQSASQPKMSTIYCHMFLQLLLHCFLFGCCHLSIFYTDTFWGLKVLHQLIACRTRVWELKPIFWYRLYCCDILLLRY